jgi:RNA polymerase sigma-32 factor
MNNGLISRSVARYYAEVAKTNPVHNSEEERRLILRWQRYKDKAARDAIINSHLRFVVTLARRKTKNTERLQDLIAAGNLGLVKAVDKYDLARRPIVRFLTYAGWWIQKEMLDEDYATSSLVHVPTHRQKAHRKQMKEFRHLLMKKGPEDKRVQKMDPGEPEGTTIPITELFEDLFTEVGEITSTEVTHADSLLRQAINQLSSREQTVLNLYFGIKDEPRNLIQIAGLLGVSPELVRLIKVDALEQLKQVLAQAHRVTEVRDAY